MKHCPDCDRDLPVEAFAVRNYHPDGSVRRYATRCKPCHRAYQRGYHARLRARRMRALPAVECEERIALPAGPFNAWVGDFKARRRIDQATFAALVGRNEAELRHWREDRTHVLLDTVDQIMCRAGEPHMLRICYPRLFECVQIPQKVLYKLRSLQARHGFLVLADRLGVPDEELSHWLDERLAEWEWLVVGLESLGWYAMLERYWPERYGTQMTLVAA